MSRLWSRLTGLFSSRSLVGIDKAGNRYFARTEEIDGAMKEKRWVIFKGEQDPTGIPVEWICWLNGQRKKAPTPEEMAELEARREQVKMNIELLKKEEEKRKAKGNGTTIGRAAGPDLKSYIRQFPTGSDGINIEEEANSKKKNIERSSEPTGSGESFRPGAWQPPV